MYCHDGDKYNTTQCAVFCCTRFIPEVHLVSNHECVTGVVQTVAQILGRPGAPYSHLSLLLLCGIVVMTLTVTSKHVPTHSNQSSSWCPVCDKTVAEC